MPDVISNTSPLQYLYQTNLLDLLPTLYNRVIIPDAVVEELKKGRELGIKVPDPVSLVWIDILSPQDHQSCSERFGCMIQKNVWINREQGLNEGQIIRYDKLEVRYFFIVTGIAGKQRNVLRQTDTSDQCVGKTNDLT